MKKNKKDKPKHCCKFMDFLLDENKVAIYYNPIYKEYFIRLWSYPNAKHVIYYCPWCGHEFTPSLINEYFDTLQKEYNINYCDCLDYYFEWHEEKPEEEKEIELPEEFKSDEWWKKRGL